MLVLEAVAHTGRFPRAILRSHGGLQALDQLVALRLLQFSSWAMDLFAPAKSSVVTTKLIQGSIGLVMLFLQSLP